ncbi:glycosyltransferase family 4 protein [Elioraea sp. Yellowstone]|jgi:glycosyltransferase involved in cell wall biosynthesis|uniref:glycosyltransferase family 4 protein n=1 Tax=Elioraea sp. Yellowstone TaxID=2592070 RepID=UPI0011518353|nr:glycosyltransferase family 4 protein [Elioraea sp. Yellowstone]TQF84880.1 glycosyltransferase family 4 protein [Elioraea sp. Yellowstone]
MRIGMVAPLAESVPPALYGGTERVVHYLTEELVRLGCEVTLFAAGDSRTSARLVGCAPRALRLDPAVRDQLPHHIAMLRTVREQADRFDLIHANIDWLHYPALLDRLGRTLTTLHGRLDLPDLRAVHHAYPEAPLVSVSEAQRAPLADLRLNWMGTVHHGLPADLYRPSTRGGDTLLFLGRISPEKRPDRAIRIAAAARMRLRIAAKVDAVDRDYHEREIAPLMRAHDVEFVGEVDDAGKQRLLAESRALLFPIDWPEPFGLVMIEAMACGTPVIAWRCGSVPEVVEPGVTGFIVASEAEAAEAARRAVLLDRGRIRARFEARFTAERMARDYLAIYARLCESASQRPIAA